MTKPHPVQARLSIIANLAGRSLSDLYVLFRQADAPQVAAHVGGVPVYDVDRCMEWLNPAPDTENESLDLTQPPRGADRGL